MVVGAVVGLGMLGAGALLLVTTWIGLRHFLDVRNPRSAAERRSWTRRLLSSEVSGLPAPRRAENPWTHVRIVFEPLNSRNRRRAENTDFGVGGQLEDPVGTSLTALTCVNGRLTRSSAWPILDIACRIPP